MSASRAGHRSHAVFLCHVANWRGPYIRLDLPRMSSPSTKSANFRPRHTGPAVRPRRGILIATTVSMMLLAAAGLAPVANAGPPSHPKDAAVKTYIIKTKTSASARGLAVEVDAAGGQIKDRYKRVYPGFSAELTLGPRRGPSSGIPRWRPSSPTASFTPPRRKPARSGDWTGSTSGRRRVTTSTAMCRPVRA